MFWAIACLVCGIAAGRLSRSRLRELPMEWIVFFAILALLFIMGAQLGANAEILDNIRSIGLEALLLTLGAVAGSILAASCLSACLAKKDRRKADKTNPHA